MLYENNLDIIRKNFSVGVRIEHKQSMINESQYGGLTKLKLPSAEYKLAYHGTERSCYTFCMCPGGEVIASSSEHESIVTNALAKTKTWDFSIIFLFTFKTLLFFFKYLCIGF